MFPLGSEGDLAQDGDVEARVPFHVLSSSKYLQFFFSRPKILKTFRGPGAGWFLIIKFEVKILKTFKLKGTSGPNPRKLLRTSRRTRMSRRASVFMSSETILGLEGEESATFRRMGDHFGGRVAQFATRERLLHRFSPVLLLHHHHHHLALWRELLTREGTWRRTRMSRRASVFMSPETIPGNDGSPVGSTCSVLHSGCGVSFIYTWSMLHLEYA